MTPKGMDREEVKEHFGPRCSVPQLESRGGSCSRYRVTVAAGDNWPSKQQLLVLCDTAGAPFGGDAKLVGQHPDGSRTYLVTVNTD